MDVEPLSERIVRVVDNQTTKMQPDTVGEVQVLQLLAAQGSFSSAEVREAIRDAVEGGSLARDGGGRLRIPDGVSVPSRY